MSKSEKISWAGCPVRYAADMFGDKWSFVLLRDILLHGKRYYGEFLSSQESISTNILADRLLKLEKNKLVTRQIDKHKKSKVCYLPTQKARALLPALLHMMVWATQYDEESQAPEGFAAAFVKNPEGTIASYQAEIDRANIRVGMGGN